MEFFVLGEPKVRGYRKHMLSLWLNKGMFWVSEKRLVDQANTIRRNSWMTESEVEELERKLAENESYKEEERSADDTGSNLGEEVRDILTALEADEEIGNLEEDKVTIIEEIVEVPERGEKDKLPALKDIPKRKLLEETAKVDKVLCKFKTHSITKTTELFCAEAVVVTNRLGVKINKPAERKEPMWRRRLQNKIKELRKDLSQLESSKDKEVSNVRHCQTLERKYCIRLKTLGVVIEELKMRIVAIAAKVRRYQERVDRFRQNRMFQNNQRQFYRELSQEGERCDDNQPDAEESKKFWGDVWSESVDHNRDEKWLKNLQGEVNVTKQEKVDITKESLKKILGRMSNWKSPGPDLVQGFWLKNFSTFHVRVKSQLKECLDSRFVPIWLTRGRTALLQKDKSKGNIASNYRPMTCLPLMWKLLSGVIADQIYGHLDQQKLLTDEQKGCRKRSRGTNDLLYTDRAVIREVKSRKKNLAMAWINYKKAYDMVPHSWIKECLDLFGVVENIKRILRVWKSGE